MQGFMQFNEILHLQDVSNPMSQKFPAYSPPTIKQKLPINMGLK